MATVTLPERRGGPSGWSGVHEICRAARIVHM